MYTPIGAFNPPYYNGPLNPFAPQPIQVFIDEVGRTSSAVSSLASDIKSFAPASGILADYLSFQNRWNQWEKLFDNNDPKVWVSGHDDLLSFQVEFTQWRMRFMGLGGQPSATSDIAKPPPGTSASDKLDQLINGVGTTVNVVLVGAAVIGGAYLAITMLPEVALLFRKKAR